MSSQSPGVQKWQSYLVPSNLRHGSNPAPNDYRTMSDLVSFASAVADSTMACSAVLPWSYPVLACKFRAHVTCLRIFNFPVSPKDTPLGTHRVPRLVEVKCGLCQNGNTSPFSAMNADCWCQFDAFPSRLAPLLGT